MSTLSFRSTVSTQEAEALKEMIFKRVRERAENLTEETKKSYTQDTKFDVMNLARDSFVAKKNPFSLQTEEDLKNKETSKIIDERDKEIGFVQRDIKEVKVQLSQRNNSFNTQISENEKNAIMNNAHLEFNKTGQFTGALEFLNSQATIGLIKNNVKHFDTIA